MNYFDLTDKDDAAAVDDGVDDESYGIRNSFPIGVEDIGHQDYQPMSVDPLRLQTPSKARS